MSKKLTPEEKKARAEARKQARIEAKEAARIEAEKNQSPVARIEMTIEWKKSRTWGMCPKAEAKVHFKDGHFEYHGGYYASGCGYDKESTVIAEIFNDFLKYKLWEERTGEKPYGVHRYSPTTRGYSGGVGTDCYYRVAEYIGGEFTKVASGKTFDVYSYTDKE